MEFVPGAAHFQLNSQPSVVTIGNFDGVHLGHQALIERAKSKAQSTGARCLVLTFDPHPSALLAPERDLKRLYEIGHLGPAFEKVGVDVVLVEPFTEDFSKLTAYEFANNYLHQALGAEHVVVGHDFRFGAGREGHFENLQKWGEELGFTVESVEPVKVSGVTISSSLIRQHLAAGEIAKVTEYLGRPYEFVGQVGEGDGRGVELGFPTANVVVADLAQPALGVYAGRAQLKGEIFDSVINIGRRPTFKEADEEVTFEVHFLDAHKKIYGEILRVSLISRLRDELKFSGRDELIKQIGQDIEQARQDLRSAP